MLRDKINEAVKGAMKAQEKLKLSTLRLVNAAIQNADIEAQMAQKPVLSDDDILGVLQKMIKQRVQSGKYATQEDVIRAGLESLQQQEQLGDFRSGELDRLLAEGERSIRDRGTLDGEKAYRARKKRRAQNRIKAR